MVITSKTAHMSKYPASSVTPGVFLLPDKKCAGTRPMQYGIAKSQKIKPITCVIDACPPFLFTPKNFKTINSVYSKLHDMSTIALKARLYIAL